MPEVMAKFPSKKTPGKSQKKRRRYVKVLELLDQCCALNMVTTAALELIEYRVLDPSAISSVKTMTSPNGAPLEGRIVEFEQILPNEEEPMTVWALEVEKIATSPARAVCPPERFCKMKQGDENPRPDREVGVLLGQPHVNRVITRHAVPMLLEPGKPPTQFVTGTVYGIVFTGLFPETNTKTIRSFFVGLTGTERIANLLEAGFKHDELSDSPSTLTVEEEEARKRIQETLVYGEKNSRVTIVPSENLEKDENHWPHEEGQLMKPECILGSRPQTTVLFTAIRKKEEDVICMTLKPGAWTITERKRIPVLETHESYHKVLRLTATVLKATRLLRSRLLGDKRPTESELCMPTLLEKAERYWIKKAQHEAFGEEIDHLRRGETFPNKSPLRKYFPFLDEYGILCVGGCPKRTSLDEDIKKPQILPQGTLSTLILRLHHLAALHNNPSAFARVSKNYHILGGWKLLEKIQGNCQTCRRAPLAPTLPLQPFPTAATRTRSETRRCG